MGLSPCDTSCASLLLALDRDVALVASKANLMNVFSVYARKPPAIRFNTHQSGNACAMRRYERVKCSPLK